MSKPNENMYDAVVIGAGIGGLVCGCYLAKAGMKVLIVEQHDKPGGYCTSFKRRGFLFDAAPHCFGSYRAGGSMRKVLEDLSLEKRLHIYRSNPSDMIITPDYHVPFWNDLERTTQEFTFLFPEEEKNLRKFFSLLLSTDPSSFSRLRKTVFATILSQFFSNTALKTLLSMPLLAISGLPPSLLSAFVGAKLYSEFIFDGGYYPIGGMQALPDLLATRFREFGGELRLSTLVKKIVVETKRVAGVNLDGNEFVPAHTVVSNGDMRQTFLQLLGEDGVDGGFLQTLNEMKPSFSNFILYIGIDKKYKPLEYVGTALMCFTHYGITKSHEALTKGDFTGYGGFALRVSHDDSTIYVGMPAPYKSKEYWAQHKGRETAALIKRVESFTLPSLSKHILYQEAASPHTMHRYTLNYQGAASGWAGIPSQLILPGFRKPPFIQGMYMVGHWTTRGEGISGAAYVGADTAKLIMKRKMAI